MRRFRSLIFLAALAVVAGAQELPKPPVVETVYGEVEGFEYVMPNKHVGNIFLGIPYARPPLKDLRFEKPLSPKVWTKPLKTVEFKPACAPLTRPAPESEATSEDCLYLNIFAPRDKSYNPDGYPVLFFVHGGGFSRGGAASFGYKMFADRFVAENVVVVTVQYRLGALGFLAYGDDSFPGNYGLWDLVHALKFVKRNIRYFNGDASRVTIFGHSAGASAVSALALSKHSQHLFAQVIQASGSSFAEWSNSNRGLITADELGQELKCGLEHAKDYKECMQRKPLDAIWDAIDKIKPMRYDVNQYKFQPRLDADFFHDDLPNLVEELPHKTALMGLALEEAVFYVSDPFFPLHVPAEKRATFSLADFKKFLNEIVVPENAFGTQADEVRTKILDFYVNRAPLNVKKNSLFYLRRYIQLLSDVIFNVPLLNEARLRIANGWEVYLYLSVYINKKAFPEDFPVKKACHGFELPYLFDAGKLPVSPAANFPEFKKDDADYEFGHFFAKSLLHFVKTGSPKTDEINWQPSGPVQSFRYLEFKPYDSEMKTHFFADRLRFWLALSREYDYDVIRGIHHESLRNKDEL